MWLDWMLAPAEVPATTAPRWCAATIASPTGVPQMIALSLSWLPPVMKMPVAFSRIARPGPGPCASSRLCGRTSVTSAAPSARNSASYTSTISSPREDAVGITAMRASGPPLAATNSLRIRRLRSLSSAPPMIMRGRGHDGHPRAALRDVLTLVRDVEDHRRDAPRQGRAGRPDRLRAAAQPSAGTATRPRPGAWLAARGVEPEQALVSAAVRTQQTWEALAEGAGWDLEGTLERGALRGRHRERPGPGPRDRRATSAP